MKRSLGFNKRCATSCKRVANDREMSCSKRQTPKDFKLKLIDWYVDGAHRLVCRKTARRLRQLVEVEATRDLTQTIVHVDMDAFVSRVA